MWQATRPGPTRGAGQRSPGEVPPDLGPAG